MKKKYTGAFLLAVFFLSAHGQHAGNSISPLINSIKEYNYPPSNIPVLGLGVLENGMIMLPLRGGIFLPEWNSWYMETKKNIVQSVSPCPQDTSLLLALATANDVKIVSLKKLPGAADSVTVIKKLPKGFYSVHATGTNAFYFWGIKKNGSNVYFCHNDTVRSLFSTTKIITAFAPISNNSFLFSYESKIILMTSGQPPTEIINFSDSAVIDGLAVGTSGEIFASTKPGIFKIDHTKKVQLVLANCHGKLAYWRNRLFVLYQAKNKIIRMALNE